MLKNVSDKEAVQRIMEILMHEHLNQGLYQNELITQLVNTTLLIVARNRSLEYPVAVHEASEKKVMDILSYIQSHIYFPEKLRVPIMASHFNLSEVYLGRYFKKHAGQSLQQYILQYKLKLIENRLLRSSMRMNEIADEFGFTDKSHLNRFFQKAKGVSPSEFRNTTRQAILADLNNS